MQTAQHINNRKEKKERARASLPSTAPSRGFTILFAVLIASVMLAVGIAIFNITIRELRLSSVVRDSEKAIYAADSGGECALYHSFKLRLLAPDSPNNWTCNGQFFTGVGGIGYSDGVNNGTSTITITYANGTCATVNLGQYIVDVSTGQMRTLIESHGYNPCDQNSPARVERVYRITF